MRIVSLLPSTTEILFALGAGDEVVGVTFECDFPPEARKRPVVSTSALGPSRSPAQIDAEVRAKLAAGEELYRLDEGALGELAPDLILTQDLCAVCAVDVSTVDDALRHLGCGGQVLTVDPADLAEVLESIAVIGRAAGRPAEADLVLAGLRSRLDQVAAAVAGRPRRRVAVVEWTDPVFTTGHWVPDMVTAAGGRCVFGGSGERSAPVAPEELAGCAADLVVVAPCGFDLAGAREQAATLMDRGVLPPGVPVWAVDADAVFVRPGPRLVDGVEALAAVCHPGALPPRPELAALVGTSPSGKARPAAR